MDAAGALPGLGWSSVMLSLASLGVVCLVAWGALRLLAGRGVGKASGAVRVIARCLLGVGDGPMTVLAELDGDKVKAAAATPMAGPGFAAVLARVLGKRPASPQAELELEPEPTVVASQERA